MFLNFNKERKIKMKKIRVLLLTFVLALGLVACKGAVESGEGNKPGKFRSLDEIKESGKISIGVFSDKAPFGYVDENGDYTGYDIYLAERLAEDLGVEAEYVSTEAANRVEYLESGKVDLILANFTVTDERSEKVDFALPYMKVGLGVVSPKDSPVTSLDEADWNKEDEMIVISGTTAEIELTKNYPHIKLQKYDTYANAKNALENGNGAAWANDNTEVIAFVKSNDKFEVTIAEFGETSTIAPAVSKGNDSLKDWINDEIEALGSENFFHKNYEETLVETYGKEFIDDLVIEGGKVE